MKSSLNVYWLLDPFGTWADTLNLKTLDYRAEFFTHFNLCLATATHNFKYIWTIWMNTLSGMTGPPNSFTARGPVTLTTILFPQPAV